MLSRFNNDLADWARSAVEQHGGLSLRQIEIRTGIAYTTVKSLLEGRNVGAEIVMRFALGFDLDVPNALRIAGYSDLAEAWETGAAPRPEALDQPHETREPFIDDLVEAGYQIPEAEREEVMEYLRFKLSRAQRHGVIGTGEEPRRKGRG